MTNQNITIRVSQTMIDDLDTILGEKNAIIKSVDPVATDFTRSDLIRNAIHFYIERHGQK